MKNSRNSAYILIILIICLLITGCSDKQAEQTAEPDIESVGEMIPENVELKYETDEIQGYYGSNRLSSAKISVDDNNTMTAVIQVNELVDEDKSLVNEWTMSGEYDPVEGVFSYKDAVQIQKTRIGHLPFESKIESEEPSPSPMLSNGAFIFNEEENQMTFTWKASGVISYDGEELVFRKETAELLREEDMIGMWVKGGGIELIVDLKEDGSLDSYVNVPEEDGMGPEYYKDGSWAIDGREVRMTIGSSEFYYHGNADSLIGDYGYVLTPMSEEVKQKFFSNR